MNNGTNTRIRWPIEINQEQSAIYTGIFTRILINDSKIENRMMTITH